MMLRFGIQVDTICMWVEYHENDTNEHKLSAQVQSSRWWLTQNMISTALLSRRHTENLQTALWHYLHLYRWSIAHLQQRAACTFPSSPNLWIVHRGEGTTIRQRSPSTAFCLKSKHLRPVSLPCSRTFSFAFVLSTFSHPIKNVLVQIPNQPVRHNKQVGYIHLEENYHRQNPISVPNATFPGKGIHIGIQG